MRSPTDGTHSKVHACQKLPMDLLTDMAKPMRVCFGAQFPMDFEKYGGIFKIFGARIN
jgi:hypothetical protein